MARNPEAFAECYGMIEGVEVLGPYSERLKNGGEQIELAMPGDEENGQRYFILVDAVEYSDDLPWPGGADGAGKSLE